MPLDAAGVHAQAARSASRTRSAPLEGAGAQCQRGRRAGADRRRLPRSAKTEPALAFDCLSNLSGVDYPKREHIQVVYHLFSYPLPALRRAQGGAPRDDPVVPTVSRRVARGQLAGARGLRPARRRFAGHPDLRRILLPEDWVGHPLRKDFVEPEEYHGISTSRESLLKV